MRIIVQVGEAVELVDTIGNQLENALPLMQDVQLLILRSIYENFIQQGRPERWHEWSERYAKTRASALKRQGIAAARASEERILIRTGQLWQSLGGETQAERNEFSVIPEPTADTAFVGSNVSYAEFVQEDRQFILLQEQDIEDILQMHLDFFLKRGVYAA